MTTVLDVQFQLNNYTDSYRDKPISLQMVMVLYKYLLDCPNYTPVLGVHDYDIVMEYLKFCKYEFRFTSHNEVTHVTQPSFVIDNINVLPFWKNTHYNHECFEVTNPAVRLRDFVNNGYHNVTWEQLFNDTFKWYDQRDYKPNLNPITHDEVNVISSRHSDSIEGFDTFHNELIPYHFAGSHNSWKFITWHKVLQLKVFLRSDLFTHYLVKHYREDDVQLHKHTAKKILKYLDHDGETLQEFISPSEPDCVHFLIDNQDVLPDSLGISSKEQHNPKVKLRKRLDQDTFIGWDFYFTVMFSAFYDKKRKYVDTIITD